MSIYFIIKKDYIGDRFLIDEQQNIHKAYCRKNLGDHIPVAEILTWKVL